MRLSHSNFRTILTAGPALTLSLKRSLGLSLALPPGLVLGLVLGLALGLPGKAAAEARPAPHTVEMEFVFLWRSLPVWRLTVEARIAQPAQTAPSAKPPAGGVRYTVRATSRALGVVWLVTRSSSTSTVEGRLGEGGLLPARYVLNGSFKGRARRIEIAYPQPGRPDLRVSPPGALADWSPVPPALRHGTTDPLTALAGLFHQDAAAPCAIRREIYDGQRRYRLTATRAGADRLSRSLWNRYAGPATRCRMASRTLAGYHRDSKAAKAIAAGRQPEPQPPGTVWIARIPGTDVHLPVKLQVKTRWGDVRGELYRYKVTKGGAPATGAGTGTGTGN